ncbi:M24 family metallopeptidase [Bacillus sp. Marseille-P3661]|uniref:M24 family metallopeptidase n=1 Tax=Bacillus sp. Marseille-P3661 TaxID=1936234 RepID=UPI000C862B5A|nr:Xaa-Pro peptidase family protein [Bacillus sp. Marseille-P3661]
MEQRITKLMSWLKTEDISFSFITSTPNIYYLSQFYTTPHERIVGIGVFSNSEPFLICPKMEVDTAKESGWKHEIVGYSDIDNPWEFIQQAVKRRNIDVNAIAVEKGHLSIQRYEELLSHFPATAFTNVEPFLNQLRLIKDEKELSILRKAAELADFGVEVGVNAISEGKSELEIVATIEFELKKKGVQQMSFATMVLTGAKTASPHGTPDLTKIQSGDLVLFDLGVILDGYCSDITRTIAYQSISDKQHEIYDTVLKSQQAAIEICKPGEEIGRIDTTARSIIEKAGYGDYFTHRIGHGLGIDVHEFPSMNSTNTSKLQHGMTFTIEPGIYVPAVGGVRIEDDLYITKDGVEILTKYPKELQVIKK